MFNQDSSVKSLYKAHVAFIKEEKEISQASGIAGIGFVKKGEIYLSTVEIKAQKVEEGKLFLIPPGMVCSVFSSAGASVIFLEVPEITTLCHHFFSTAFFHSPMEKEFFFFSLPIHMYMQKIIDSIEKYIQDKVDDPFLIQIKVCELFYFIKHCYTEDLIRYFLSPILSEKYQFTHFVLSYYRSVKTAEELARLSNYSLSGFDKQFRKVFGIAPYKWMLQRKTQSIYSDIYDSLKPLKLIAEQHNFETPSGLTDFCRRHMGLTPSEIREKRKK